jgi:hypothetical protein
MAYNKWDHHVGSLPVAGTSELSVADRRREAAERDAEVTNRKMAEREQMRADTIGVSERIRLWETHFGLDLPRDPAHPLLEMVAQATSLTVADIRAEQRERAHPG